MIQPCCVQGCPRIAYAKPVLVCDSNNGRRRSSLDNLAHCQRHMEGVTLAEIITDEIWAALLKNTGEPALMLDRTTLIIEWHLVNELAHG